MALYRDAIRDVTLKLAGFDVWDRVENPNWSVLIAFLLLLVIGLGVIGWLVLVVAKAKPEELEAQHAKGR
ncbi:MAG: hypothetical protein KDB07_05135 [Planctomycetes bacterium]|nr:hypothetical protein [Planctomycetota bacterium]